MVGTFSGRACLRRNRLAAGKQKVDADFSGDVDCVVDRRNRRAGVKSEQVWWNPQRWSSKYHSFPSGHVDASTAFFAVLAFASWRIGLPLLTIPILIGFSRMYLGAHYLSDVVCAAVLGIFSAIAVTRFFLRRREKDATAV
ncbi:MAG: hypothetical protein DME57_04530 [Verrucomicrobia bacterium]|nr:MAG: hypothetical protein DME57_04530 [Verrucomicrobiota bacterium]